MAGDIDLELIGSGRGAKSWTGPGIHWPDPVSGPWNIRGFWIAGDDGPELVGMELWRGVFTTTAVKRVGRNVMLSSPPGGFNATTFRELRFGEIERLLLEYEALNEESDKTWFPRWLDKQLVTEEGRRDVEALTGVNAEHLAAATERWRRARSGFVRNGRLPENHFEAVARVYLTARAAKQRPTMAVHKAFTVSYSTAEKWVRRCRDLGLIEETSPGKTSGAPRRDEEKPKRAKASAAKSRSTSSTQPKPKPKKGRK
ncbi:MAG: hypothetical protein QOK28_2018 [Actinomycetota bacterium]|jgi:hypothetical protein